MTPEELKAKLGIAPTLARKMMDNLAENNARRDEIDDFEFKKSRMVKPYASKTVIKTDDWDLSRGREISKGKDPEAFADFFAMHFREHPKINDACVDEGRHSFISKAMETNEYLDLHITTSLDDMASTTAAKKMYEAYSKLAKEKKDNPPKSDLEDRLSTLQGAVDGLQQAKDKVETLNDFRQVMGYGGGCGDEAANPTKTDPVLIVQRFDRIMDNETLRAIFDRAGAYLRCARGLQRRKISHGYDDMVDITLSSDPSKLLSSELVKLCIPELKLDTLYRMLNRQTMARKYRGIEKVGKGPVVLVTDESSSMHGPKNIEAKAFALAMVRIARHQKRMVLLSSFAHGPNTRLLKIGAKEHKDAELLEWISGFEGGGTTFDVPLRVIPNLWEQEMPVGKTDMILLTDGEAGIGPHMKENFLEWKKKNQVRLISLIVGSSKVGSLETVSDEAHLMRKIGTEEKGIQSCLSI